MGRPLKDGIDYITLYADWDTKDMKTKLLTAQYGSLGRDVYLSLLCMIARDKGYYMLEPTVDDYEFFAAQCSCSIFEVSVENIKQILSFCLQKDLFCQHLFDSCKVITSYDIQERYIGVVNRRTEIKIWKEIWLYEFTKYQVEKDLILQRIVYVNKNQVSANQNRIFDNINPINVNNNPIDVNINPVSDDKNPIINTNNPNENISQDETNPQLSQKFIDVDKNPVSVDKNPVSVDKNRVNVDRGTQSRVEYSKEEERREKEEREGEESNTPPQYLNFLSFKAESIKQFLIQAYEIEDSKADFITEKYLANRTKYQLEYNSPYFCDKNGLEIASLEKLAADLKVWMLKENNFSQNKKPERMTADEYAKSIENI